MGQRFTSRVRALAAVALLLLAGCGGGPGGTPDPAPDGRVDFTGVVQDAGGSPVPGAQVLFGNTPLTADAAGEFHVPDLTPGSYALSVYAADQLDSDFAIGPWLFTQVTVSADNATQVFTAPDPGLVIADVYPRLNMTDVRLDRPVVFEFKDVLLATRISAGDIEIIPAFPDQRVEVDGFTLTITSGRQLLPNQRYTVTLKPGTYGSSNQPLEFPARVSFRTEATDTAPPRVIAVNPPQGADNVPINQPLRFEFNEPVRLAGGHVLATDGLGNPVPVTLSVSGRSVTVTPETTWTPSLDHDIELGGLTDAAGNELVSEAVYASFRAGTQLAALSNVQPEWSLALDAIVFARGLGPDRDIYRINPDGSGLELLVDSGEMLFDPTVSADGALLAWSAGFSNSEIYVAPLSNLELAANITQSPGEDWDPRFSRTFSRTITFVSDRLGPHQLFRMAADGSGAAALAPSFGSEQREPSPHPLIDNQLLFTSTRSGSFDIWSMSISAVDGEVTALNQTNTLSFSDSQPDWTADANGFVFISDRDGEDNLWVGDLTGGSRRVTSFPMADPSASPVPGSTRCVASMPLAGGGSDLVIIDTVSGLIVRNLTTQGGGN